jgi:hypothetical protein
LFSHSKVLCHDWKDFDREIKNIRHDLILNDYSQEFIDSIMKPLRSNHPASDSIYQGTVIIAHVKGINEKCRCTGNRFNVRTIFQTLCGIMINLAQLDLLSR